MAMEHAMSSTVLFCAFFLLVSHAFAAEIGTCSAEDPYSCISNEPDYKHHTTIGNKTYHPSFGLFPKGCKWRIVSTEESTKAEYQFWDFDALVWVDNMPASCVVPTFDPPGPPDWKNAELSPRSEVECFTKHCMYNNLYYHNGRWYALVDGPTQVPSWKFSRNQEIIALHVDNATSFANSVKRKIVPGDTILFDFIFFVHPTAIGHWWEMVGPLYSILKDYSTNFKRPCTQFILLHLQRQHILEWVRAMIAVALGVGLNESLPPVLMQEETENAWLQITQQLQGFDRDTWYLFERVLIVKDLATGGSRTFLNEADAQDFRGLIYKQYGLPEPAWRPEVPRTITFQRKTSNRRIINEPEFIDLLRTYGELKIVEYNSTSSLHEQLLQMRDTGIFVAVHTSNLANAPLLQPGSAVFEIIQRHWHWGGLDTSFRDQTAMMQDIHHFAYRCNFANQTIYVNPRDKIKVGTWNTAQCATEICVESHTMVDVIVDIAEIKKILDAKVPGVWANQSVVELKMDWPIVLD